MHCRLHVVSVLIRVDVWQSGSFYLKDVFASAIGIPPFTYV